MKAVAFEEVSPGVIEDTVNLLFNSSSVLFSHDIYQTLEMLGKSLLVKVMCPVHECSALAGICRFLRGPFRAVILRVRGLC